MFRFKLALDTWRSRRPVPQGGNADNSADRAELHAALRMFASASPQCALLRRFAGRGKHGGDNRRRRGVDGLSVCGVEPCANLIHRRMGAAAPARVPDRRGGETSIHQPSSKQQVMSDETPIVAAARTHVKVYASERVDGALGEDGLEGERCVVINCIPQLLLREAALAICALGRQDLRSWARPPGTRRGEALLGHGGAPMAGPPLFAYPRPTVAAINGHAYAGGLITGSAAIIVLLRRALSSSL